MEKGEPRVGVLGGEVDEVKATTDAWVKWWASKSAKKNIEETKVRLTKVVAAVEKYKAEQGAYPGILEYLQTKPETPTAKPYPTGGYFTGDLKDAWGRKFIYRQ